MQRRQLYAQSAFRPVFKAEKTPKKAAVADSRITGKTGAEHSQIKTDLASIKRMQYSDSLKK